MLWCKLDDYIIFNVCSWTTSAIRVHILILIYMTFHFHLKQNIFMKILENVTVFASVIYYFTMRFSGLLFR